MFHQSPGFSWWVRNLRQLAARIGYKAAHALANETSVTTAAAVDRTVTTLHLHVKHALSCTVSSSCSSSNKQQGDFHFSFHATAAHAKQISVDYDWRNSTESLTWFTKPPSWDRPDLYVGLLFFALVVKLRLRWRCLFRIISLPAPWTAQVRKVDYCVSFSMWDFWWRCLVWVQDCFWQPLCLWYITAEKSQEQSRCQSWKLGGPKSTRSAWFTAPWMHLLYLFLPSSANDQLIH